MYLFYFTCDDIIMPYVFSHTVSINELYDGGIRSCEAPKSRCVPETLLIIFSFKSCKSNPKYTQILNILVGLSLVLYGLVHASTIFQLYRGGQFYW